MLVKPLIVAIYTQKYNIFPVVTFFCPYLILFSKGPLTGKLIKIFFYPDGVVMQPLCSANSGIPGVGKQNKL